MYDYFEEDYRDYYEPSDADLILLEYQEKMKGVLLGSVKNKLDEINNENIRLRTENETLKSKEKEVINKERALERDKQKLESELKNLNRKFINDKFSDIFKDLIKIGYSVDCTWTRKPKCNICDDNRKIEYRSEHGLTIKGDCSCAGNVKYFKPDKIELYKLRLNKRSNNEIWLNVNFCSKDYDDKEINFKKENVFKSFDEKSVENKNYYNFIYLDEKECQKHCDWLNSSIQS